MLKPDDPRDLVLKLLSRSTCAVQVASVIADDHGVFSWGHNHVGFDGFGMHAECDALRRANKKRLQGSTIYIASVRKRSGNVLMSKPCVECQDLLRAWGIEAVWRDKTGEWILSW
jgi:deoxycytidylate deaminase